MHVMICDDSALARKSLNRSICTQFDVDVVFSENGREALSYLSQNNVDILFLDLTMPVMDGFQVLQALPVSSYPTKVIVISGDIQLQAKSVACHWALSILSRNPIKLSSCSIY